MRLSSKPDVERLLARRDVDGLIRAMGTTQDPALRAAAEKALVGLGAEAIPSLVLSLGDASLREFVVQTLIAIGPLTVDPLIQTLKATSSAGVRMAAAAALGKLGMLAVDPLTATLRHRSEFVRQAAGSALAGIGIFAVEPLMRILANSVEPSYVRRSAAFTLGMIGGPRVATALTRALQDEHSEEVRSALREALQQMGWHTSEPLWSAEPGAAARPTKDSSLTWPGRASGGAASAPEALSVPDLGPQSDAAGGHYRWTRFRAALPELKAVGSHVIQRLCRASPVYRYHATAAAVIADVEAEFVNYSRLRDAEYAAVSVKLVFDNSVERNGQTTPATRQLEVVVVYDGTRYVVYYNSGFVEVW